METQNFIENFGDVLVQLKSYYKYCFTFQGETEKQIITLVIGGDADDIYRLDLSTKTQYKINDFKNDINWFRVVDKEKSK